LNKPTKAVFTKTPLKKIEKAVLASTWVLDNQKLNGQSGNFTPKPIKKKIKKQKHCFLSKKKNFMSKK
jgi:hypothetical protein